MEANWETRPQRAARPLRLARRGGAREPLRDRHPQRRERHPEALRRWRRARPQRLSRASIRPSRPSSGPSASWSASAWRCWRCPGRARSSSIAAARLADARSPTASPAWPFRAGSRRSPAGTRPRSAASPGWSTGVLTTADAVAPVPGAHVALTLAIYVVALSRADGRLSRRPHPSGAEGRQGRRRASPIPPSKTAPPWSQPVKP